MKHWALDLIGLPWQAGATGPEAFDCWGLVRWVQARHYARELPPIAPGSYGVLACARTFRDHPERARWSTVTQPGDGDCVLMSSARQPTHIGIWIDVDGGGVLHCAQGAGVVFQSLQALRLHSWSRLQFLSFSP